MNIIKPFRGINKHKWLLIIFIFSYLGLISCSKEAHEPKKYFLRVENNYFESVSVTIATYFSEKIPSKSVSTSFFLPKGKYIVTCTTQSSLQMQSTISLQGSQEQISIEITPKGKIVVK